VEIANVLAEVRSKQGAAISKSPMDNG